MKLCSGCNLEKDISRFKKYSNSLKEGTKSTKTYSFCRECFNNRHREKRQASLKILWRKNKVRALAYLGGKCADCGLIEEIDCVYDFHHIEGKDYNISNLLDCSWAKLEAELDKCVLLCANCHRKRHYYERKNEDK